MDEMIVAGGECEKKLYKNDLFSMDGFTKMIQKRIHEAREEAVRELLDELYMRIIKLQAESLQSYADVLDIIDEYRKAYPFFTEPTKCVCPHPGHLCGDCSISGGNK